VARDLVRRARVPVRVVQHRVADAVALDAAASTPGSPSCG
jgi:hypothetical protein